ncbi:MAG: hypothetical protein ACJAWT_002137 [Glaciecola sp.]|jgi:hypothetical protein
MARKQPVSSAGVPEHLIQQQNYKDPHRNKSKSFFWLHVITGNEENGLPYLIKTMTWSPDR